MTQNVTARQTPAWTVKRFLEEKTRQAVNIKRAENYLDQAFDQGADPKELQRLLTVYRNDIIASPYASGGFIRPLEEKAWGQAVDYSMFEYSVEFLRDKMIPTMQFQLSKGDVAAAKRVWDMREKKADDPAKLLRDAIKDMRGRKWMEPVFKFGAFTILNDAGISEGHAKHLFEAMTNVERLLKSKGLGYLLNGVMYLTHAGERFDAAYMPRNDRVEINYARGQTVNSMTRALVHELGHRLWFKFMDTGARDLFAQQWLEKGEDTEEPATRLPSVTPYGTKNRHEDFAETFTEVVMGKQKDRRLAERLQAVIPKGRVLSSVTADVDAMNQFVQSARQALVPIQKAEDKVIALIEKWAMNGVVNMRQLKMALTAHNKAVAQLNKLNLPANLRPGEREILQDMINTVNFFNVEDVERETKEFKKNLDKMEPGKALARFRNRIGGVAKQVGTMSIPNLIEKAQEFVEPELKFGPFTVIDNHGILKVRARYWFEVITRGSKILKQKGFGYLLYGNLKLEPEEKGYNGTYYSYGDYIRLNTGEQGRPNDRMLYTFIHELGHRLWFKFMDAGARDRFANPWLVQEEQLPAILKRANELLAFPSGELEEGYGVLVDSDFAYAKFMGWVEKKSERKVRWMKLLSRVYALSMSETEPFSRDNELNKKAFELTRQQIKKRKDAVKSRDAQIWGGDLETEEERIRAAQQRAQKRLDSDMRMFRKDFDKAAKDRVAITMYDLHDYFEPARSDVKAPFGPVIKDAMKLEKIKPSVTDYGQTNRMEDFAEVFAQTILGINKDRAVQQRLQAVLPKGRVMAGVLPSLHNLVQDAKFGIETDHKEMVKKARAWQRFRDNNMRKYDAFVAKHGDEAVFCEICWKGTLRSKAHVVMADEDLHVNAPNSRPRYIGPTCWKLLGPTIRPYEVKQPVSAGYVGTVELTAEQLTRALWGKPIDYINKGVYEGTGIPWRKVPKDAKLTVEIGRGGGMVRDSDGGWIADRFGPELGHRDAQKVAKQMGLATASAVGQNWFGPFGQRYRIVEDTGDGWRVEIQHSSSDLPAEESWTFTKQQFERLKESLPLSRSAEATAAPEMPFNVGDEVLFGKYKNKRGRIVQFGKNPKGQVTVQIEPIPKGRKKTKEMGLFKIWTTPGAVEAVASKYPIRTVKQLVDEGYTDKQAELIHRKLAEKGDTDSWTRQKVARDAAKYPRLSERVGDKTVTVYRVVPRGVKAINLGDYVFRTRQEAEAFRDEWGFVRGQPNIISLKAPANQFILPHRDDTELIYVGDAVTAAARPEWVEKIESGKGTVFIGIDDGEPVDYQSWLKRYLMFSKSKQTLDVEGYSLLAPELRGVLQKLVKLYPPAAKWSVRSDGPAQPIERLLKSRGPKHGMPKHLYHGTSTELLPHIMKEGLKPRTSTSIKPTYQGGAKEGRPERIYLASFSSLQATHFAAREAASKHGGEPVVLRITTKPLTRRWTDFKADEDSRADDADWIASLYGLGTVAYEGTVPPSAIQVFERMRDRDWYRTKAATDKTEEFWRFVDKAAARFDQFPEWMFHREPVDAAPKLLYHGTRGPLAASIVNKGLRSDSGFSNFGGQAGVSFTRDLQTAKQFGNFIVAVDPKRLQAAGYELQDVQHPTAPDEAEVRVTKGRVTVVPAGLFEKVLLVRPQGFELKWWAKTQPNLKVEVANVTAATAKPPLKELARSNKTFKGPNGNELAGYQWVSRIEDVYSKREDGLVSKRVSDWDKAVPCSTCRRNIVHVYWVKDQAGKFEPYGADHLHVGLGYPRELRKAEIERLRQRVTDVSVQQKEEGAHRKKYEQYVKIRAVPLTGNPIREANMRFLQSGGQGKPPPTFLVNRKTKQVMRADDLALDRFVALMPGWERETPAAIKEMAVGTVTAATDELYHTTSLQGLAKILQSRTFRSGAHGGFISFSEKPLFGDISAGDAVIVLDKGALRNRVMPVEYTERWFDRYPEHAEYIAGEGWREQYMEPEDCYDEEGWAGDECLERAYRGAELEAFLWKKDEREWIGRSEGDIRLPAEAFKRVVCSKAKLAVVEALLKKLRLKMPVKVLRDRSTGRVEDLGAEQAGPERDELLDRIANMQVGASHSHQRCMECDAPPETVVLWADGRGRAWFCKRCLKRWETEEERDVVRRHQLRDGEDPRKFRGRGGASASVKFGGKLARFEQVLFGRFVEYLLGGVNIPITLRPMQRLGKSFGYIRSDELQKGVYNVRFEAGGTALALAHIAHEVTHVLQYVRGDLRFDGDTIMWKGKPAMTGKEYAAVKYAQHAALPWEKEAHVTQKTKPAEFLRTKLADLRGQDPTLDMLIDQNLLTAGTATADALDTEQSQEDEATAIETPKKYRNRTGRCPPGHKSNEKETCIDMKERRKKRRWEKQQRDKERRLAGR